MPLLASPSMRKAHSDGAGKRCTAEEIMKIPDRLFLRLSTGVSQISENAEYPFVITSYLVFPGFF